MKIKVFYPTKNGKIVLDKNQLEALLTEAYEEGHKDGYNEALAANPPCHCPSPSPYPYPYLPTINEPSTNPYTPYITWCSQTPENYVYNQKENSLTAESECNCSNTIKCMKCKGE